MEGVLRQARKLHVQRVYACARPAVFVDSRERCAFVCLSFSLFGKLSDV
jgi:hypothetical protein